MARVFLVVALLLATLPARGEPQSGAAEEGGLRIGWQYTPAAGAPGVGVLELRVSESATGAAVRYPPGGVAAWFQRRRPTLAEGETACAARVGALRDPRGLGRRADIDVDTSRILSLNRDGTLAAINPFVGLNNAKLESIVELGGAPRAWVVLPERMEAWVVLAAPPRLVAVDLQAARVVRAIDLPGDATGGRPLLAWDGGAARLYVGLPGRAGIGMIEPARPDASLTLLQAAPPVGLLAGAADALAGAVSLHADGAVLRWTGDAPPSLLWRADPAHDGVPRLAGYSALARRIVVATDRGALVLLDPEGGAPRRLAIGHAARAMALLEEGRRALVLGDGEASVIDLAVGAAKPLALKAPAKADTLLVTDAFAYAVSPQEGRATLWRLADLRQGVAQPVEVTVGPPDPMAANAAGALAVPTAARDGLLLAGPGDGVVRQYSEGQMAYRGDFSTYRRAAAGIAVLDLALRETAPGVYRAPIRHERGGPYTLVLAGGNPRFTACDRVTLPLLPADEAAPGRAGVLSAEMIGAAEDGAGGRAVRVRLRDVVAGGGAVAGVSDLTLQVFDPHSGWARRLPMAEVSPGEYEARITLPPQGARYDVMVASASRELPFARGAAGSFRTGGAP